MMEALAWTLIGCCVGTVAGLTGAGGAMVSVPLFVLLTDMDIKEATGFSLFTVFIGASMSWAFQAKHSIPKISLALAVFSWVGSKLTAPYKALASADLIMGLFIGACIFSLYNLWKPIKPQSKEAREKLFWWTTPLSGIFLGVFATMTGLGGGVVLMPWLRGILKLPLQQAVATSLLTITLVSTGSIVAQGLDNYHLPYLFALVGGVVLASLGVRRLIKTLPQPRVDQIRKTVFTAVVLLAIFGVLSNGR